MLLEQTCFYAPRYRHKVVHLDAIGHRSIFWGVETWEDTVEDIEELMRASQVALGRHPSIVPYSLCWTNLELMRRLIAAAPWTQAHAEELVLLEYSFVGTETWFSEYATWLTSEDHHQWSDPVPVGRIRPFEPEGVVGFDAYVEFGESYASRHATSTTLLNRFGLFDTYEAIVEDLNRFDTPWPTLPRVVAVREAAGPPELIPN